MGDAQGCTREMMLRIHLLLLFLSWTNAFIIQSGSGRFVKQHPLRSSEVCSSGRPMFELSGPARNSARSQSALQLGMSAPHLEWDSITLDRRALLLAGLSAGAQRATAYDFREEGIGGDCGVLVPAIWKREDGEASIRFSDPVSGAVLSRLSVATTPLATKAGSIKDLGKVESLNIVKALGVRPELGKADMVGAGKHGKGSSVTYDYDLAIAPKTCSRADEVVSGSCAYTEVILLSAFVDQEKLNVLEIVATAEEWKKNGPALRGVRNSFARKRS